MATRRTGVLTLPSFDDDNEVDDNNDENNA